MSLSFIHWKNSSDWFIHYPLEYCPSSFSIGQMYLMASFDLQTMEKEIFVLRQRQRAERQIQEKDWFLLNQTKFSKTLYDTDTDVSLMDKNVSLIANRVRCFSSIGQMSLSLIHWRKVHFILFFVLIYRINVFPL